MATIAGARAEANPSLDRPPRVEAALVPAAAGRDPGRGRRSLEAGANLGVNLVAALMLRDHEAGEVPLDPDLDRGIPIEDQRPVGQRKTRGRSLSSYVVREGHCCYDDRYESIRRLLPPRGLSVVMFG